MRKPLIVMLIGAALVWGCTMWVHNARADDEASAPKWYIAATITDPEGGEHKVGIYATDDQKMPRLFDTEADCIKFTKTDKLYLERSKKGFEIVKRMYPGHRLAYECKPDLKKNEI